MTGELGLKLPSSLFPEREKERERMRMQKQKIDANDSLIEGATVLRTYRYTDSHCISKTSTASTDNRKTAFNRREHHKYM